MPDDVGQMTLFNYSAAKKSSKPKPEEHDEVPTEVLAMKKAAAVTFFVNHSSYGELITCREKSKNNGVPIQ